MTDKIREAFEKTSWHPNSFEIWKAGYQAALSSLEQVAYCVWNNRHEWPVEEVCKSKAVADSWLQYCGDRTVLPLYRIAEPKGE